MMIFVLNCGSSSVKYKLFDMKNNANVAEGKVERINEADSKMTYLFEDDKITIKDDIKDHEQAINHILELLTDNKYGALDNINHISAIGHRVVHGGEEFSEPTLVTDKTMKKLGKLSELAPLHNPHNITGIQLCKKIFNNKPQVAVFDTGFHQSMDKQAYLYGIPYSFYEKYGIRKYGFHGISHEYVSKKAADFLDLDINNTKMVTCHLGNGASVTAIKNGKSIDTSMGFTPLEGLIMGTRSGDIDPAIIPHLSRKENISCEKAEKVLNEKSGLLGISGISNDFRDIKMAAQQGKIRALLAINMFNYRIKKYIGSYAAAMNGLDAIVFTGGIGENSPMVRKAVLKGLQHLGVKIDTTKNKKIESKTEVITKEKSKITGIVIPTDEELLIAKKTHRLIIENN